LNHSHGISVKLELYATFLLPVFQFVARPPVAHGVYESSQPTEILPNYTRSTASFPGQLG